MFYNMFYSVKISQKAAKNDIKSSKNYNKLKFFSFIYSELRKSLQKKIKNILVFSEKAVTLHPQSREVVCELKSRSLKRKK